MLDLIFYTEHCEVVRSDKIIVEEDAYHPALNLNTVCNNQMK